MVSSLLGPMVVAFFPPLPLKFLLRSRSKSQQASGVGGLHTTPVQLLMLTWTNHSVPLNLIAN